MGHYEANKLYRLPNNGANSSQEVISSVLAIPWTFASKQQTAVENKDDISKQTRISGQSTPYDS